MSENEKNEETNDQKLKRLDDMDQDIIEENELDRFDESKDSPILLSDYEHKAFLVSSTKNIKMNIPEDVLDKDLELSVLDKELAFIYSLKAGCVEDWGNLGLRQLARRRSVSLRLKLNLNRSIGGFERLLQTATPNVNAEMGLINGTNNPQQVAEQKAGFKMDGIKKWFQ